MVALSGTSGIGWGPSWPLGAPFIRNYCHIYDATEQRIGFAPSKKV